MKARILVIEDEMSINDLLCMNLEIAGYETVGYLDGNEAYEAIIQDGAEDYIVKPFEMLEVMVRLEKVLERNGTVQEQIQIGDVIIDTASRTVTKMGMEIY